MKNICTFMAVILLPLCLSAQRMTGIATSDFNPTQQLYLNPASIVNKRYRMVVDVLGINFGADNDAAGIRSGRAISKFLSGNDISLSEVLVFSDKDRFNLTAPYAEVRGPGLLYRIRDRHSIALSTRLRAMNQFRNFSQQFYRSITDQDYGDENADYQISSGSFDWSAQMWSEIGLSYAAAFLISDAHRLKGGITLRYLGGIGFLNAHCNNLDAHYYRSSDSLRITNTDISFSSNILRSDDEISSGLEGSLFGRFLGSKGGSGLGADIGLIYEYVPGSEYLFRLSVSVIDIGSIRYHKNNRVAYLHGDGYLKGEELGRRIGNFSDARDYAQASGLTVDTSSAPTKMQLPASLIIGGDYRAWKNICVNALLTANLVNTDAPGNNYYTQITVTPRYEYKLISAALPVSYSTLSKKMKLGFGFRISGFFFGSDDMIALLGSRNQYGTNLYLGGFVPIYDRDKNVQAAE